MAIQVFRGFPHSHFAMLEETANKLGRLTLSQIQNPSDLDPMKPTMLPLPTNGLWNCAPRGEQPGLMFEYIADGAVRYLGNRRNFLCLDAAGEGFPLDDKILLHMDEQLRALGIPAGQVVVLTSDLRAHQRYRDWAARGNHRESFVPLSLDVQFYYLSSMYREKPDTVEDVHRRALGRINNAKICTRKYLSFNYTPRAHRIALVLFLYGAGLLDEGYISFHGLEVDNGAGDSGWRDASAVRSWLRELGTTDEELAHLPGLYALGPIKIEERERFSLAYDVGDIQPYFDSYFSIITETVFQDDASELRFTEKTYKAMANAHPFLLIGNPGLLKTLRERGFATFGSHIDETYDDIVRPSERLAAIKKEVSRLCALPHDELAELYAQLWPAIRHNFNMFHHEAGDLFDRDPAIRALISGPPFRAG